MDTLRTLLSRWFLPLFATISAGITLLFVVSDASGTILRSLLQGALALVVAAILFVVGYRYVTTTDLPETEARTLVLWTLAGVSLLAVMNVWFRLLEHSFGEAEPRFAAVTSLTAGALGGAAIGISVARARRRHTEREQALADYREIFEQAGDGIAINDPETGKVGEVNQRYAEMVGYDADELRDMQIEEISADDPSFDQEQAMGRIEQALDGEPQQFDWLFEGKDGSHLWVEVTLTYTKIGGEDRLLAVVRDVSERKQYEQELEVRSKAMEASIDGIAILDENEEYTFVNQAHADVYGYENPDALLGETWKTCYDDAELDRFEDEVLPVLFEEGAWRGEATGVRKDGSTFPQELSLTVTSDGGMVCVVRDVSTRKKQERQISTLHDATREMVQATDEQSVCEIAIRTADEVLEFPVTGVWLADDSGDRLEPAGLSDTAVRRRENLSDFTEGDSFLWQAYATGKSFVFDDRQDQADVNDAEPQMRSELIIPLGEYGVLNTGSPAPHEFTDNDVVLAKLLGANARVALERVERERDLERQTDQMEFFNSILRHDVLNGITVIRGRAEFLEEALEGDQKRDAETIVRWSNDIVNIVQRVRTVLETLTGKGDPQLEAKNVRAEVGTELERIRSAYPEVTVETAIPDDVVVLANDLLGEVLGNVITNAIDHNETDGLAISITVEERDEFVTVRIADDGAGVSDDRKEAIFRRGETGHVKSTGSGFGLFFVDSMIDEYGGDVWVEDSESGGAAFVIKLRTAAQAPPA